MNFLFYTFSNPSSNENCNTKNRDCSPEPSSDLWARRWQQLLIWIVWFFFSCQPVAIVLIASLYIFSRTSLIQSVGAVVTVNLSSIIAGSNGSIGDTNSSWITMSHIKWEEKQKGFCFEVEWFILHTQIIPSSQFTLKFLCREILFICHNYCMAKH
ncbi:hypothetical protein O6P43_023476 [Quillaja saponaria]|uniref:Uncharacterized protein n=1 Tax=Quillaja saponaria TaxID=32244 RepID=A0AAD7LFB0_QUISA|nr:hypothetical protein O6P43_023476 [Quillaja saponaria]